jgi:hypothetical protein
MDKKESGRSSRGKYIFLWADMGAILDGQIPQPTEDARTLLCTGLDRHSDSGHKWCAYLASPTDDWNCFSAGILIYKHRHHPCLKFMDGV